MDTDDQQSTRSSSSRGNTVQQQELQCQQQMSLLNLEPHHKQMQPSPAKPTAAEVSQAAGCPLNVMALVEVHRMDIPDFHYTFKYEFNATAGHELPTVEEMLCMLLPDNLDEFDSMEELLEQFELLQVQHQMEDARTNANKLYVDISKKQQRKQKVQDRGDYRVVLRPKNASEIDRNPRPAGTTQSTRPSVPPRRHDHTAKELQQNVDPTDKPVRQQKDSDQAEHRSSSSMHRYVLSDGVQLGQLYNAHTDNIIPGSGYDSPTGICSDNFRPTDQFVVVENLASVDQRLQLFGIEQKISVVSKLAEVGEHNVLGNFLRHAETHGNSAYSFGILYTSSTKTFELHHGDEQLLIAKQQRKAMMGHGGSTDGTHAVRAITYGFMVGAIFTVQQPQQETNKKPLEAKDVQKLVMKRLRNEPLTYAESSLFGTLDNAKVMVTVFSNNNGSNDRVTGKEMSITSALELFDAAKRKTGSADVNNVDIGHPIICEVMKLAPIIDRDQRQHSQQDTNLFDQIKTHIELVEEFDHDNKALQAHVDQFAYCLKEVEWQKIKQFGTRFDQLKATFGKNLRDAILQFRAHAEHGGNMALLGEEQLGMDAIHQLHQQMRNCMESIVNNKAIALCCYFKQKGVRYIGRGNTTLEAELAKNVDVSGHNTSCSSIMLFWDQQQAEKGDQESVQNAQECWALFEQLILARGCTNCMFLDLSLAALPQTVADVFDDTCSTRLIKFVGTPPVATDYLQEEVRKRTVCVARRGDDVVVTGTDNQTLNLVVMPCPNAMLFNANSNNMTTQFGAGAGCCPNDDRCWECDECGQYMRLNKSDLNGNQELWFYCECGRVPVSSLRFRCPSCVVYDFGGRPFAGHTLHVLCARLRANLGRKNKHILILGETGVGKSTWINALANYMTYGSLTDAIHSDGPPVCLIPAHFTITDGELRQQVVRVGSGFTKAQKENENLDAVGDSSTKGPHTYKFNYLGGELRLIDTAGIGDTAGIEQDKRNFDALLKYLANIGELHGICILLHPNKSRLSVAFRYCIGELFSHLHRNASQNIVFCFTNARGTLYKPGDTLPPLRKFLDQLANDRGVHIELNPSTVYCMDNESFRFLCAVKDGVEFSPADFANFEESWRRTESETNRMLAYLDQLKPHRTEETTSLNEARRLIFLMSKPLASVTSTIQTNISAMNNRKEELASLDANVVDFNSQLMIKQVVIESKSLPYPRTVCTANDCTELCLDADGQNRVMYTTHCHEHCYLDNVTLGTYPEPALQNCYAMSQKGGQIICDVCDCLWSMHMHVDYEQYEVTKMVEDPGVRNQLQSTSDKRKQQEILINDTQERIRQYKEEQGRINAIAAKFASFLQHNAIMTYNDALREYLQLQIREAKRIAEQSQHPEDSRKLTALEEFLAEYMAQRSFFEQSLSTGSTIIEPRDIKQCFEELKNLPLTGEDIRKLFEQEEKGQDLQMNYMESACPTNKGRRKQGQQRQKSTKSRHGKSSSYNPSSSFYSASSSSSSIHYPSSISRPPGPPLASFFSSAVNKFTDVLGFNHHRHY